MKKITLLSLAVFLIVIVAISMITILYMPYIPSKCPYGHSNLIEKTQKVSFIGTPSDWDRFCLKYINPPDKYQYCQDCGWCIYRDGECYRTSKDPESFNPSLPSFIIFNYPNTIFKYERKMKYNKIMEDHVFIDGYFNIDVEKYILSIFSEHGISELNDIKGLKNEYGIDEPTLEANYKDYLIKIKYENKTKTLPRRYRLIKVIYNSNK